MNFNYHTKSRLKLTHSSSARTVDFEEMMIPPHDPVAMLDSGLLSDGDSIQETSGSLKWLYEETHVLYGDDTMLWLNTETCGAESVRTKLNF